MLNYLDKFDEAIRDIDNAINIDNNYAYAEALKADIFIGIQVVVFQNCLIIWKKALIFLLKTHI